MSSNHKIPSKTWKPNSHYIMSSNHKIPSKHLNIYLFWNVWNWLLTSEPLICAHIYSSMDHYKSCNMPIRTILVEPITWKHAMMVCVGMVWLEWTNTHERTIMDEWMDGWMNDAWTQHFQIGWMDGAWTYMWRSQDSFS
jgi:hypothetical protein